MASEAKESANRAANHPGVMQCQIAKLADEDLAAIFKYLPPYERLIVSEVCRNWCDISKTPWRDVAHLDLSQVPTQNIHAIIKKCPNLISISALRQNLGDLGRFVSRLSNIVSLKCVDCTFTTDENLPLRASASLRSTSWNELIWHNSKMIATNSNDEYLLPCANPPTLRRLQISSCSVTHLGACEALREWPLLESFIFADLMGPVVEDSLIQGWVSRQTCLVLENFASLRELYLDSPLASWVQRLVFKLPQLKMLYLSNVLFQRSNLTRLLTQHASLSILVITASRASDLNGEVLVPVRKLFPNGFNAQPVPPLHLFLGKIAAEKLRFHPSPTDALKIYPIDAPLPEFLGKEEIKAIFDGSWIASRIKEGAKEGVNLADYSFEGNAESISYVQK